MYNSLTSQFIVSTFTFPDVSSVVLVLFILKVPVPVLERFCYCPQICTINNK